LKELIKKYKDVFAWTYKYLKGIPLELVQHKIEMDTTIPPLDHAMYRLNPNYITTMKQDIDRLLIASFIHVEVATWLSLIMVVPKKNGKLKIICVDFRKLNSTTKKYPFPLPFTNEVLNTMVQDVKPIHFGMDIMGIIKYP
jgi:hypothetical protein